MSPIITFGFDLVDESMFSKKIPVEGGVQTMARPYPSLSLSAVCKGSMLGSSVWWEDGLQRPVQWSDFIDRQIELDTTLQCITGFSARGQSS